MMHMSHFRRVDLPLIVDWVGSRRGEFPIRWPLVTYLSCGVLSMTYHGLVSIMCVVVRLDPAWFLAEYRHSWTLSGTTIEKWHFITSPFKV
ncbi:hypothetical protein BDV26DRAFT_258020 [Aspergillus bertholletiae]|uniref:Uncharacterized protein n=1 Tax=Aspergillus bertholletiae TaxID=1226010 RepID=A0A5N7BEB2_9EURO|nr:hypothetical protein BDV26DRAFT_258020 [Aspergillus bertholletiae]